MTGNRISQAYIELRTSGEGRVRRTIGALRGDMKTLDAQTKTTESRLEKLGKGADGLQGALGKLLMPIAFIGAVAGVASQFTRMLADAQAFRREMDQLSRASGQLDAALGERSRGRQFGTPEDIAALKATNDQLDQLRDKGAALAEQAESDIFSTVLGEVGNFFADDAVLTAAEKIDAIDAKANELATAAKAREGERAAAEQAERERRAALTRLETDSLRATELKAQAAAEINEQARAELEIEAASIEHGIRRVRLADEINQLRRAGYDEEADALAERDAVFERQHRAEIARIQEQSRARQQAIADDAAAQQRAQQQADAERRRFFADMLQEQRAANEQLVNETVAAINSGNSAASTSIEGLLQELTFAVKRNGGMR